MKFIFPSAIVVMICFLPSISIADSKTIRLEDLKGKWGPNRGFSEHIPSENVIKNSEIIIYFESMEMVTMIRRFPGSYFKEMTSESFEKIGNLFWWRFPKSGGDTYYELVLGGWASEDNGVLFGNLYLLNDDYGVFNGMPISLKKLNEK